ncbi:MAG TPA: thioredoxin domain-containing protein [Terracidiphilus sp.]|jgi:protein-disulfide isomerase|nr:thioredoxin domain-containing protein [Terracidiphilus sp.]
MRILLHSFFSALSTNRACRAVLAACAALLLGAVAAGAQANSASLLKPPAGARVAIVEFGDLQCPSCAHANPILKEAAAKYHIPWVRHDFLIPDHNWSRIAAVDARWFDTKSKALGDEYRDQVFANQNFIETPVQLNQFTQKFAQSHGIALPFAIDPQGKLMAEVNADVALGNRLGVTQTPTIYIVSEGPRGISATQVKDVDSDLYSTIDAAMARAHR